MLPLRTFYSYLILHTFGCWFHTWFIVITMLMKWNSCVLLLQLTDCEISSFLKSDQFHFNSEFECDCKCDYECEWQAKKKVTPKISNFVQSCQSILLHKKILKWNIFPLFNSKWKEKKKVLQPGDFKCGIRKKKTFRSRLSSYPKGFFFLSLFASNWTVARDFQTKATLESFWDKKKNILNDVSAVASTRRKIEKKWLLKLLSNRFFFSSSPPWAVLKVNHSLLQ